MAMATGIAVSSLSGRALSMPLLFSLSLFPVNSNLKLIASPKNWNSRFLNTIVSNAADFKFQRKLVLYSKKECCLCDSLKEKLQMAFKIGGQDSLSDVQLEIRDITTNPQWEKAYQYEIPVLARVLSDGSEETLPRMSPRLSVEQVQKKLTTMLR